MNDELEDLLFLIEITDGYSFRNLIDYLRYTNVDGTFALSKKRIFYFESNGENSLFNNLVIKTCKLTKYMFNLEEPDAVFCVKVQLSELQANTKGIGKKDGVRLYQKIGDPNLYVQILSTNRGGRGNILFVKTSPNTPETYEIFDETFAEYKRTKDEPNANCILNDFAKTMKNLAQYKSDYILLKGYPRGMSASAYSEGRVIGRGEDFGNCKSFISKLKRYPDISSIINGNETAESPEVKQKIKLSVKASEDNPLMKISSKIALSLAKTNNTSSNGIIRMYLEYRKPCRFIFPIGYYGKLTIYIKDDDVEIKQ